MATTSDEAQYSREREVAFMPADEEAFCELLRQKAPNIRFLDSLTNIEEWSEATPQRAGHRTVQPCVISVLILFAPSEDWQPELKRVPTRYGHAWRICHPNRLSGRWWRAQPIAVPKPMPATYRGPRIPPGLDGGRLYFSGVTAEQVKLAGQLIRLVSRVATNKLLFVRTERDEPPVPVLRGGRLWAGHHAVEWARQSPDRILGWTPVGAHSHGYRPLD